MATLNVKYYSDCLRRQAEFEMFIPNDMRSDAPWEDHKHIKSERPLKTLFLLHGYSGDPNNWIPVSLCYKYNIAVVMPRGENGFWTDGISTGHQYGRLIGEELPEYIRNTFGLAKSSEDTYIMGLSMGGYGALRNGLAYPDVFGKIGAMSAALIVHDVAKMSEGNGNAVANFEYYRECFGLPEKVIGSANNPETLVDKLIAENKKFPDIYMSCGAEDFLLKNNRVFHDFLNSRNVPHEYVESKGKHDMTFWSEYTQKILEWMFRS